MPKYLPQHLCLNSLSPRASLHWRDQVIHPHKTNDKIMIAVHSDVHIPTQQTWRRNTLGSNSSMNLIRSNFSTHSATFDEESDRKVTVKRLAEDLQLRNMPSGDCGWIHSLQEQHVYKAQPAQGWSVTFPHAFGWHVSLSTHRHCVSAVCAQERCENEHTVTYRTRGMIRRILRRKANAPLQ
jgi:hypothetical protein